MKAYLDGALPPQMTVTPTLSRQDFATMDAYRELVVAVLKTNYGAELVEIMQRETHSVSSGLEINLSPDE